MKGTVVDAVPPPDAFIPSSAFEWDELAEQARKAHPKAVKADGELPEATIRSLRRRTRSPYVTVEGRIVFSLRNSRLDEAGKRYGEIYLEWQPATEGD